VTWPSPVAGLVIRYAYLWRREAEAGREEGAKDRPAAIVAAVRREAGETLVYVLPITHATPRLAGHFVEIPGPTKARLGLDGDRSFVILTEVNVFAWPGPDLRMVPGRGPDSAVYGMLPPGFMRVVQERFARLLAARQTSAVKRTQ
jgi:hypothetical protein